MNLQCEICQHDIIDTMCTIVLSFLYGNIAIFFVDIEDFLYVCVVSDGDTMVFENFFSNLAEIDKGITVTYEVLVFHVEI